MSSLKQAIKRLKDLPDPSITIDEAIVICQEIDNLRLAKVVSRIKQLREERDCTRDVAEAAMSNLNWERSDVKKWADKQRIDPDND